MKNRNRQNFAGIKKWLLVIFFSILCLTTLVVYLGLSNMVILK